jgi:predicted nucleic acid-binding Zn ribbon protein
MTEHNQYSLGDALKGLVKKHGLEQSMNEHKVKEAWHKTVGEYCSKHTETIRLSKGELTVKISSAAVKQELMYAKTEILNKINECLNQELITNLKIF